MHTAVYMFPSDDYDSTLDNALESDQNCSVFKSWFRHVAMVARSGKVYNSQFAEARHEYKVT